MKASRNPLRGGEARFRKPRARTLRKSSSAPRRTAPRRTAGTIRFRRAQILRRKSSGLSLPRAGRQNRNSACRPAEARPSRALRRRALRSCGFADRGILLRGREPPCHAEIRRGARTGNFRADFRRKNTPPASPRPARTCKTSARTPLLKRGQLPLCRGKIPQRKGARAPSIRRARLRRSAAHIPKACRCRPNRRRRRKFRQAARPSAVRPKRFRLSKIYLPPYPQKI